MKAPERITKRNKLKKGNVKGTPQYYFHADEDFREDWEWGKAKMTSSKLVTKLIK